MISGQQIGMTIAIIISEEKFSKNMIQSQTVRRDSVANECCDVGTISGQYSKIKAGSETVFCKKQNGTLP